MIAEHLKKSIFQAAIQGKLSQQLSEDGDSRDLLKKIEKEKARLIKEGKIKNEKPLPEITDDEIPFDIPENWCWGRFSNIIILRHGHQFLQEDFVSEGIPVVKIGQCKSGVGLDLSNCDCVSKGRMDEFRDYVIKDGDILMALTGGTLGKVTLVDKDYGIVLQNYRVGHFSPIREDVISRSFVALILKSGLFQRLVNNRINQNAQPNIGKESIDNIFIPIPPFNEQKRIVKRLNEILPEIDRLNKDETKLESLQKFFPKKMKDSILQYAIEGKLTEQSPSDGDARDLVKEILKEKARLIKEGRIKKEKPLPEITEDEIPFDIPENWQWSRIGVIFTLQAGKFVSSDGIRTDGKYPCYGGNGLRGYVDTFNRTGRFPIIGRQGALCGNINIAEGKFHATEHAVVVENYYNCNADWAAYFLRALDLNQYSTATAQPGLAVTKINQVPFPVPPFAEQNRIVERLEELLPEINKLENLMPAKITRRKDSKQIETAGEEIKYFITE